MNNQIEKLSENKIFSGLQSRYQHHSQTLRCDMVFSVFMPSDAEYKNVPAVIWLSGLTCDDQNFVTKAGAQRAAQKYGVAIICPDTSPRGELVADDVDGAWDFGLGAGFYVNATQEPWSQNYQMYDYVAHELPALLSDNFAIEQNKLSISGHSMGGHGALVIGLRNPDLFCSISAFSPIVSPMNCPWGEKALSGYLGAKRQDWLEYDSCELISQAQTQLPVLVDQGLSDDFLLTQLKTELLVSASKQADYPINVRYHQGYDHSYFFIASFIEEHIVFHHQHISS